VTRFPDQKLSWRRGTLESCTTDDLGRLDSPRRPDTDPKTNLVGSKVVSRDEAGSIAAARAGDLESFEDLVAPYQGRLYRVLLRMVGSDADAQDLLQESLFKAFEKIAWFRAESAFGTWLHRIGVNQALMWLRKNGADPMRVVDDPLRFNWMDAHARPIENWSASAESGALRAEAQRVLARALSELPEIDRAVVLLKDTEGLSHDEIAEATGLTVVAARSRLHRARLVLRERLSEYFRDNNEARDDVQGIAEALFIGADVLQRT
jgi:RNA polymerase sigma-70 factor (ECF subfamily)